MLEFLDVLVIIELQPFVGEEERDAPFESNVINPQSICAVRRETINREQ